MVATKSGGNWPAATPPSSATRSGIPIYATPGRRGGYALDIQHTLPPLNLSAAEVAAVERAIVERRVVEIDYVDKVGEVTSRTVEPVAVLGVQPFWYLWAYCRLRDAPRAFRLDRIRSATILEESVPDRGLDPVDIEVPDFISRGILGDMDRPATKKETEEF